MKIKIMIVTEDSDTLHFLKKKLNHLDAEYEVTTADNGMKCLRLLEDNHIPDIILMDIKMDDGMNGIDVFNKLKKKRSWKSIPVVFLVNRDDGVNEYFVYNVLGAEYILKPVDITDLKESIDMVLAKI